MQVDVITMPTVAVTGTFWQATQPVSIADGADVTLGAKADARNTATDTTEITVMQVLKEISYMEQNPATRAVTNAGTFVVQENGSALTALQLIDDAVYVDDADWTGDSSKHLLVGGVYQSTPQTVTDGDVAPFEIDVNGNLKSVIETLISGEDQTNDVLKTEQQFSYSALLVASAQVKASAGFLHTVTFACNDAAPTAGTIDIYDNPAASGTKIFSWTLTTAVFSPVSVLLDVKCTSGIYVAITTTADVNVLCSFR